MFDTKLVSAKTSSVTPKISRISWYTWPYCPLIAALMLALLLRVILFIHAGGVMDGDEALVGVISSHLTQGVQFLSSSPPCVCVDNISCSRCKPYY